MCRERLTMLEPKIEISHHKILSNLKLIKERLNEDKSKFIAVLAHDLINPFNSILGFIA